MPHFTVMIGPDGPAIDLAVAVSRAWQRRLATQGSPVPSPTTVRALIDTGSDLSVVLPQILQQLGVQATGSVRIRRPGAGGGFRSVIEQHVGRLNDLLAEHEEIEADERYDRAALDCSPAFERHRRYQSARQRADVNAGNPSENAQGRIRNREWGTRNAEFRMRNGE